MNLKVTSQINLSTGSQATNAVGYITAHTDKLLTTGKVPCDLEFYLSKAVSDKKFDKSIPVILKQDGTIQSRVGAVTISLTEEEAMGADLPTTIFNKVAEALGTSYGWTVVVEE